MLALLRAPVRDELHTLAQARATDLDRWWRTTLEARDRTPALANLVSWSLGRVGLGSLDALRAVSVLGWAVGSAALAAAMRRTGATAAAVVTAGALPSASGLLSVDALARPYGLAFAALGLGVERWAATFPEPSRRRIVAASLALGVAVALHYALVTVLPVLAAVEVWERRRRPGRTRWVLAGLAAAAAPLVVLAVPIVRSLDVVRSYPRVVGPASLPAFYLSVLRPLVAFVVACLVVVLVAAWRRRGRWRAAGPLDPLGRAAVLLALVVPPLVVAVVSVTSEAYLHRYALGGLVGMALAAGTFVAWVERSHRRVAAALAALVVASIVPSAVLAVGQGPTRSDVRHAARALGLARVEQGTPVMVVDPFVLGLLRDVDLGAEHPLVLAGPSSVVDERPELDLLGGSTLPPGGRAVVVADRSTIERLVGDGVIVVVAELGMARLDVGAPDDLLVAVAITGPTS